MSSIATTPAPSAEWPAAHDADPACDICLGDGLRADGETPCPCLRRQRGIVPALRWVRMPGPGQTRGEGQWVEHLGSDAEWEWLRGTGYLPTHEGERPQDSEVMP